MPREPRAKTPQKLRYRKNTHPARNHGQPGGNHQANCEGQWVNADSLRAGSLDPVAQTLEELRRRGDSQLLRWRSGHLPDDDARANQQTGGYQRGGPQPYSSENQRGQHGQQNHQHKGRRRRPIRHLHRPHDDDHVERQQPGGDPAVGRTQRVCQPKETLAQPTRRLLGQGVVRGGLRQCGNARRCGCHSPITPRSTPRGGLLSRLRVRRPQSWAPADGTGRG